MTVNNDAIYLFSPNEKKRMRILCLGDYFLDFMRRRAFFPHRESMLSASSLFAWIILSMGLISYFLFFIFTV